MRDIFNPDQDVLNNAGIHGVQGSAVDNGNGSYVVQADGPTGFVDAPVAAATDEKLDAPAPKPNLAAHGVTEEEYLKKTLKAIKKGANEGALKLTKPQSNELKKLRKTEGRPRTWTSSVTSFLRKLNGDGTLPAKLKAAGLEKKDPNALRHVEKLLKTDNGPKPQAKATANKIDPKTGRVITKKEFEAIQAKSRTPVFIQQTSQTAQKLRAKDGYDTVMAEKAPQLARGNFAGLKNLAALIGTATAGRMNLTQATAAAGNIPKLTRDLNYTMK